MTERRERLEKKNKEGTKGTLLFDRPWSRGRWRGWIINQDLHMKYKEWVQRRPLFCYGKHEKKFKVIQIHNISRWFCVLNRINDFQ